MKLKPVIVSFLSVLFLMNIGLAQDNDGTRRGGRGGGVMSQLDDTQRQDVHDMVSEMRDNGATREEITAAMHDKLTGWGIDIPDGWNGPRSPRGGRRFVDNDGDGLCDYQPDGDLDGDGILNKDDSDFRDQVKQHRGDRSGQRGGQNGRGMGRPRGDRGGRPPMGGGQGNN